ncbi:MAG: hypothetical protein ACFFD4_25375 [Candidatus Odinarchaeota archaeon]
MTVNALLRKIGLLNADREVLTENILRLQSESLLRGEVDIEDLERKYKRLAVIDNKIGKAMEQLKEVDIYYYQLVQRTQEENVTIEQYKKFLAAIA